jgi:hypothetical protein
MPKWEIKGVCVYGIEATGFDVCLTHLVPGGGISTTPGIPELPNNLSSVMKDRFEEFAKSIGIEPKISWKERQHRIVAHFVSELLEDEWEPTVFNMSGAPHLKYHDEPTRTIWFRRQIE